MKSGRIGRVIYLICVINFTCLSISAQDLNPANWPHLKGYWKFQNQGQLTHATVGNDLTLVGTHQVVSGPAYGDTAIRIAIGSYYKCYHNMAPNGGGDSVNQYTLLFDFKVLNLNRWHTFQQTDTTNSNDGECFIKPLSQSPQGAIGVGYTGYSADTVLPGKWYRLMISVNLGHYYNYYLNGSLIHQGDTDEIFIDKRFALTPMILFFADNNQEDDTIDIASVAIFDTCLSASDIATIGSIDPCVANPPSVNLGADTALCSYNSFTKSAGSGFAGYLWSTGETVASVNINKTKLGLGQHNVWVRVTDLNGCRDYDTISVNFIAPPAVSLGTDKVFCEGLSTNLIAGTSSSNQYLWKYLPSGDTLSNLNNITVDSTGTYAAYVTSSFGCTSGDTINVLVNPNPPKPVISVTGNRSFCMGDSVILEGPASYTQYAWTNGSKQKKIFIKLSDTVNLKVTDKNGCESPFSDSIIVLVYSLPPVPIIQITGDTSFCNGDSVLLKAPAAYTTYKWSNGIATELQMVKKSGQYSVIVSDVNGCVSPPSLKVNVQVYQLPLKPVISFSGITVFCEGDSVVFTAPSGFAEYIWQNGAGNEKITAKQNGYYWVYVIDHHGCISPVSDTFGVIVNPNPPKPLITVIGDSSLCYGDTTVLSAPAGYLVYIWSENSKTQAIEVRTTGSYRVQVVDSNGCRSIWSENRNIFIYPQIPKPDIDTPWFDSLRCSIQAERYRWFKGNSLLSDTSRTIMVSVGWYKVQAGIGKCWSEMSDSVYMIVENITESGVIKNDLKIFPNPACTEAVLIIDNLAGSGEVLIQIIDLKGDIVLESKANFTEMKSGKKVLLKSLSKGFYLLKVTGSDKVYTAKIQIISN